MALRALDVDYFELSRVTRVCVDAISRATQIRLTSPAGTDICMTIARQPIVWFDGLARERGKTSALPAGVIAVLPVPETAEGKVVLDGSVASIGLLANPIRLNVVKGRVKEVDGGAEARQLVRLFDAADEGARCIAETGLGTNPRATYVGNLVEDERVRGSGHIGFGRNVQLGGAITSTLHLDATMRKPTIYLDETAIVQEGTLLLA
jgi:leucyl aminopeptidase (aminopeptidase T)